MREGSAAARRLAGGAALRDVLDTGDPAAWLELDESARAEQWCREPTDGREPAEPRYGEATDGREPAEPWHWERTDGGRSLLAALAAGDPLGDGRLARPVRPAAARNRSAALVPDALRRPGRPGAAARCRHRARGVRAARGLRPAVAAAGPSGPRGAGAGGGRAADTGRDGRATVVVRGALLWGARNRAEPAVAALLDRGRALLG
ncbi:hypothetical protein ACF1GT_07230 [Streptomyces sp. NPDC014636]|uniref:hypothetical protein n=1 Tax=Streptomyces sp. NPDC014636 TaxID=3364876 RepID=UPI0036F96A1B